MTLTGPLTLNRKRRILRRKSTQFTPVKRGSFVSKVRQKLRLGTRLTKCVLNKTKVERRRPWLSTGKMSPSFTPGHVNLLNRFECTNPSLPSPKLGFLSRGLEKRWEVATLVKVVSDRHTGTRSERRRDQKSNERCCTTLVRTGCSYITSKLFQYIHRIFPL